MTVAISPASPKAETRGQINPIPSEKSLPEANEDILSSPTIPNSRIPAQISVDSSAEKKSDEPKKSEANETKDLFHKTLAKAYEFSNYFQLGGNLFSFVSKVLPFLSGSTDVADKAGEWGTKSFLFMHGVLNTGTQFLKKNYSAALGYLVYIANSIFLPQDKTYLMNGFAVGLTQLNNQANSLDKNRKINGIMDHLDHMKNALKTTWKNLTNDPISNFKKPDNSMMGVIGGVFSLVGSVVGLVTGSQKAGASVRDPAGLSLDVEQVLKYHWVKKRFFYIGSGISYIGGTVFDFLSKFSKQHEPILRPLCFMFDGVGRYLQSHSERRGELQDRHLQGENQGGDIMSFDLNQMAAAA